ncbi:Alpha/Beta hydrolase protein [Flammula alnicola]|nr:Alpha/Beta hydrolase protein [Flammula alnicola]
MPFTYPKRRACGTWPSPLTAEIIHGQVTAIEDVVVDSVTSIIYHIENRPSEGNRSVLVESIAKLEVVEDSFDVKTLVNNYGRAAATVRDGRLYFNNAKDHRVYRQSLPSKNAIPITPENQPFRFAFFVPHPVYTHLVFTIMENHTVPTPTGIVTTLGYIDARSATVHTLASGSDFYINPRVNSTGTKLAWMEWKHPHMQWQGAQLFVADISINDDGTLSIGNHQLIAGEPGLNAVFQYAWGPPHFDSDIVLAWDKTPFCEPWIYRSGAQGERRLQALFGQPNSIQSDFADPVWWLDDSYFIFFDNSALAVWVTVKEGRSNLNFLNLANGQLEHIKSPYIEISRLRRVDASTVVFIGTTALRSASLIRMTIDRRWASLAPSFEVLFAPKEPSIERSMIPTPTSYKIPKRNGQFTYAHFYPPSNPNYIPLENEKPPCLLSLHSGPTIRTQVGFQWHRPFYTSRGFAWLDVDYSGSTGYGKDYRHRLEGQYGIIDVEDILAAAEYLSLLNIFDRSRVCLRTSSGGSFPALQTFTIHPDCFSAAATHFIIADLAAAARDTDKLTSHYLFSLMGGTPEEIPEIYRARNPVLHADRITRPILITHYRTSPTFNQAEKMVNAILRKGGRVQYAYFDAMPTSAMFKLMFDEELSFFEDVLVRVK